jgi:hypothetical protein
VTLHAGHDVTYFTSGQGSGGCAGAMSYYTAAGEPPGEWAGKGAATLGLAGQIDPDVIGRLYQHNIGPSGELLVKKRRSKAAGDREQAAVTAYLAAHPYASATELAEVRAAERGQDPPRVPYFDLTVSAVKSVSVLHASYRIAARQARQLGDRTAPPRSTRALMRSRPRCWTPRVKPSPGSSGTPPTPAPGTIRRARGSGATAPG